MYFIAKVEVKSETDEGKFKKSIQPYVVEDEVISGVEVQIAKEFKDSVNEWKLLSVAETKFVKVLNA
jgi:hypothetical protein